ncbi:hypothetical protein IG631_11928 [Alternaria alternata]|nr:hypothetical protein IG631_11928 [Alternaria alternata]
MRSASATTRPRLTGQARPFTRNVYGRSRSANGQTDGSVRQGLRDTQLIPAYASDTGGYCRKRDLIDRTTSSIYH